MFNIQVEKTDRVHQLKFADKETKMSAWRLWIQQPTTVAGLSTVFGTAVGLALQQMDWRQAVPLLVGAAVSIVLPDNTGAKQQADTKSL